MKGLAVHIGLCLLMGSPLLCKGQLQLRRALVNGIPRSVEGGEIKMKGVDSDLLLEFTTFPGDSITYFYRLGGLEATWTSSMYPVARYQGLDESSYTFHIKAQRSGKILAYSKMHVAKIKAFWNEAWFVPSMVIYVLVLVGVGIYLFLLYDFRQKLRMQSVRNQIAADLHDEVGSNLNSIAIFVEVLRKNAPADMLPILEKIIANSRESVSLMQDTVWTINPKNDSVQKLFERMNSFASQLLAGKDIAYDFVVGADLKAASFSMDQRKSVYLIFKEAINNIVKHADATKVTVRVDGHKDALNVVIEDNGRGFDVAGQFEGNGIINFKERAREAEIGLSIESVQGQGTRIALSV